MSKVSLRYARALLLAIGEDVKKLEKASYELETASNVLSDEGIQSFFLNPKVEIEKKTKMVENVFEKMDREIINLLKLVVENGKISEMKNIADSFKRVLAEAGSVVSAKIESAKKLNQSDLEKLEKALAKMSGQDIAIEVEVDEDLLGGVRVILGDEVIDLSMKGKLEKLSKTLN